MAQYITEQSQYFMEKYGVAWFKMDEASGNLVDSKGTAAGTITGTTVINGVVGNARKFNGTSDIVTFASQVIPIGKKSIRFKVRKNGNPSGLQSILNNGITMSAPTANGTLIGINADGKIFAQNNAGNTSTTRYLFYSNKVVTDNKWHDVLFTWDGTTNANSVKLYIDDMITPDSTSTATSTETVNATGNLTIGGTTNTGYRYWFGGDLDEIEIYNDVINADTRKILIFSDNVYKAPKLPVTQYTFDNDTIAVANDVFGRNSGTVTGTTLVTGYSGNGSARSFNGTSDYIQFNNPIIPIGKKSIRFKIKTTLNSTTSQIVFDTCSIDIAQKGYYCEIKTNGTIAFVYTGGTGSWSNANAIISAQNICDNQWHDILFTWDGNISSIAKLYIDDMTSPNVTSSFSVSESGNHSHNLLVGCSNNTSFKDFFSGQLDELEIYDDVYDPNNVWQTVTSSYPTVDNFIRGGISKTISVPTFAWSQLTNAQEIYWNGDSANTLDEKDQVNYRILVNDNEVVPRTDLADAPLQVNQTLLNSEFNEGDNIVKVEYFDDMDQSQVWQGTVSILNAAPQAVVTLTPSSLHYGNATLSATIADPDADNISYRILVNGQQTYPANGFTDSAPSPVSVNFTIDNNLLNAGDNAITLEYEDLFKTVNSLSWTRTIQVTNGLPTFTPDVFSNSIGTKGDFTFSGTITDVDNDNISTRVLLNGVEVQGWSALQATNSTVSYTIPVQSFNFGSNTVRIELKDDFKNGGQNSWETTITKVDAPPIVNASMTGSTIVLTVNDSDNDNVQYMIKLNGKQVYPAIEGQFSDLQLSPVSFSKTFRETDGLKIGKNNTIEVVAQDEYGTQSNQTLTFVGDYAGIMFIDENGKYYSADDGTFLRQLDFGLIVSGQTSQSKVVYIKNKNSFNVKNIRVSTTSDSLLTGITMELSKTTNPFVPEDVVVYDQTLQYGDTIPLYVRLKTIRGLEPTFGDFNILIEADPTN